MLVSMSMLPHKRKDTMSSLEGRRRAALLL